MTVEQANPETEQESGVPSDKKFTIYQAAKWIEKRLKPQLEEEEKYSFCCRGPGVTYGGSDGIEIFLGERGRSITIARFNRAVEQRNLEDFVDGILKGLRKGSYYQDMKTSYGRMDLYREMTFELMTLLTGAVRQRKAIDVLRAIRADAETRFEQPKPGYKGKMGQKSVFERAYVFHKLKDHLICLYSDAIVNAEIAQEELEKARSEKPPEKEASDE